MLHYIRPVVLSYKSSSDRGFTSVELVCVGLDLDADCGPGGGLYQV